MEPFKWRVCVFLMGMLMTGCSSGSIAETKPDPSADLTTVTERGTLLIGVTDFPPLDHREGDAWVGFDAELAEQFASELGVRAEFCEIVWDDKVKLLDSGAIDLIWNGMTKTSSLAERISCSDPYLANAQIIVMKEKELKRYNTPEKCAFLLFACENGSAAENILREKDYRFQQYDTQKEAVDAVLTDKADAAVVDLILAAELSARDEEASALCMAYPLNKEELCVGMRKHSALEDKVNAFLAESAENGTIKALAEKYALQDAAALEQSAVS